MIVVAFIASALCAVGIVKIKFESRTEQMWIPTDSSFLPNKKWIGKHFTGEGKRNHVLIFESKSNVISANNVKEMYRLHEKIANITVHGLKFQEFCYRFGFWSQKCFSWFSLCIFHRLPIADIFLDRRKRRKREVATNQTDYFYYYDENDDYGSQDGDYYIDSEVKEDEDHKNFDSLDDEKSFKESQHRISYSLPPKVFCSLVNTLNSKCFETSILEIWKYHKSTINSLNDDDIIHAIHVLRRSPYFGFGENYASKLGSIQRNGSRIIGAKASFHHYTTTVNEDEIIPDNPFGVNIDRADKVTLDWELEVVKVVMKQNEEWKKEGLDIQAKVNVRRSFSDISSKAIFVDIFKMAAGYLLMFAYTTLMLGRLNWVELRMILACTGLFAVLLGLGIAVGLMSVLGFPYIPLHAMLPFVCLGKTATTTSWSGLALGSSLFMKQKCQSFDHEGFCYAQPPFFDGIPCGQTNLIRAFLFSLRNWHWRHVCYCSMFQQLGP